jgi:hypothetical protein
MSSAEWIEEMPTQGNGGLIPLDNFGSVQFSSGTTIKDGQSLNISQTGAQAMTMLNASQQTLASPSALGYDGASFSVTRGSAAVTTSPNTVPYGRRGWSRTGVGVRGFGGFAPRAQRSRQSVYQQFFRLQSGMFNREYFIR